MNATSSLLYHALTTTTSGEVLTTTTTAEMASTTTTTTSPPLLSSTTSALQHHPQYDVWDTDDRLNQILFIAVCLLAAASCLGGFLSLLYHLHKHSNNNNANNTRSSSPGSSNNSAARGKLASLFHRGVPQSAVNPPHRLDSAGPTKSRVEHSKEFFVPSSSSSGSCSADHTLSTEVGFSGAGSVLHQEEKMKEKEQQKQQQKQPWLPIVGRSHWVYSRLDES